MKIERDTAEIYYSRKESAIEAAKRYNHYEINGKKIKVTFYEDEKEKEKRNPIVINDQNNKLINLDSIREKKDSILNIVKSNKWSKGNWIKSYHKCFKYWLRKILWIFLILFKCNLINLISG